MELRVHTVEAANRVVRSKALEDAGLMARVQGKAQPRVLVYDVPREADEGEMLRLIVAQNFPASKCFAGANWARVSHFSGPRDGPVRNVILHVTPEVRNAFLQSGRVSIVWRSCRVVDFVGVSRC